MIKFYFMKKNKLSARSQARVISSLRTYFKFCETKGLEKPELRDRTIPDRGEIARMDRNVGIARQRVTTLDAVLRVQQARLRQALQDFSQSLRRNPVSFGDILRAETLRTVLRQVLHGHQPVIGLLCELQHRR